jgi:hypothetical protein
MSRRNSSGELILYIIGAILFGAYLIIKNATAYFQKNPIEFFLIIFGLSLLIALLYLPTILNKRKRKIESHKLEIKTKQNIQEIEERNKLNKELKKQNIPHIIYSVNEFQSYKFIGMKEVGIEGDFQNSNTFPIKFYYHGYKSISFGFERGIEKNLIIFVSSKFNIPLNTGVNISFLFTNESVINYKFEKKPEQSTDRYGVKVNINSCEVYKEHLDLFSQENIHQILIENSIGQIISIIDFPIKNQEWEKPCEIIKEMAKEFVNQVTVELSQDAFISVKKQETLDSYSRERIPQRVKDLVWKRDGGVCVKCGSNKNLEFDHIIPVSKGGANTYRNIQLLCEKCNRKKSNKIG